MTDDDLMKKLQTDPAFNPWLTVADEWLNMPSGRKYILPADKQKMTAYRQELIKKHKSSSKEISGVQFELNVLPQPFIGNPCAPIWVLLKNPGFSSADIYDLKSIRSGKKRLLREGVSKRGILPIEGLSDEEALKKRRELVCDQLKFKFEEDEAFYILRKEFKTVVTDGQEILGGYNWYKKYFCGGTGYLDENGGLRMFSRKFFVLEYVPYHSKQYFPSTIEFIHCELWRKLITHAIEGKVIVVRGEGLLQKIEDEVGRNNFETACKNRRILVLKGQSAKLSSANTYWPCTRDSKSNPLVRALLAND